MSKLSLLDSLVKPKALYGSMVWVPSLLDSDWATIERVQILLLYHIIRCHQSTSYSILLAEFNAHPFRLRAIFDLVWFLHRLCGFADSADGCHRYSYLSYCSSVDIADFDTATRAHCWYALTTTLLRSIVIKID